ncbi:MULTISPECIES: tripartite tricarboxylate transporter TctB family protein [Lysinibacillus]|uniref:Tripartite tricarboxylate transporter TctB family protein n=1 Tax=Lysinibacillus antri TaxID=2498145 RepID=A0A3S0QPI2_9BACI|nr:MULTISPECIES: tripartite tricarboxylate transporter TctB family protein [Lysinibacillus]RUL51888.1 tripartite tricarboxylate transporter TctB family protein [Lysinibacillus antri]TSI04160.1 tripartite tricarboxylate transporter TctB family protein [Lysinibacillus sp. BW-2-10]
MTKTFDKITGIVFLLISILFIYESLQISGSAYGSAVGPKTFPLILGIILGLLSLRLLYETFNSKSEQKGKSNLDIKRFGIILLSAIVYVFLLEILGYVITTFIFLVVAFQVMEKGKITKTLIIAAVFAVGVYVMYVNLLGGNLPKFSLF